MSSRKIAFVPGEYYHVYNRGVDKRNIFSDKSDIGRFLQSMEEFNTKNPIGSLYEHSFVKKKKFGGSSSKLIKFIAFCLNPNHFHFLITPLVEKGIEKFMQVNSLLNCNELELKYESKKSFRIFPKASGMKYISCGEKDTRMPISAECC
ncbi:hypothetical protein HYW73_01595 [Candidatus Nomurabacteria bacterium]|nr:hypothetical protein [Candidatus Nomurabacteria bacterium]